MQKKFTPTTLFPALLLCGLSGCDRQSKEPAAAVDSLSEDQKETQAISYYVEISNQLSKFGGLEDAANSYKRRNIDKGDGKGAYSPARQVLPGIRLAYPIDQRLALLNKVAAIFTIFL
ncbi:hypothetical protein JMY91_23465 [Brenneria goodwinii]|nr:hypothetical protein [Brenneria goodwinii]